MVGIYKVKVFNLKKNFRQLMYEAEVTMLIDEEQIGTLRQAALENTTTATPSNANRGPATVASDTAVVKEEVMSPTRPEPPTDDLSLEDVGGEENGVSSDDIEGKLSVTAQVKTSNIVRLLYSYADALRISLWLGSCVSI